MTDELKVSKEPLTLTVGNIMPKELSELIGEKSDEGELKLYPDSVKVDIVIGDGYLPENAHGNDFCDDIRAAEGRLVPPSTFGSVLVPTGLKTAFSDRYGMKANTRSGSAYHTPIMLSNCTGIIEGTYRGYLGILLRNVFIDSTLVDFVMDSKGKRIPLSEVPSEVLENAREFYEKDSETLGYDKPSTMEDFDKELESWKKRKAAGEFAISRLTEIRKKLDAGKQLTMREKDTWLDQKAPQPTSQQRLFVDLVPRGTIYIEKGERIAQIHYQPRIHAIYNEVDELDETDRGDSSYGGTGRL
ncbi:dUTP nucleotidohydrolase [Bacillus phage CAM003]|uniref:dUTP diphosphatase n=1 Tax=Bacillus phage CAM003 TaxID=1486657 RepID=A0A024B040_9CAUD|nr:dUTP nucleotidohydrolase [Bacillus phage CAM003]AHZ09556.1 dUTP nucleotidohydrolase [Bacillus phage CAM003]